MDKITDYKIVMDDNFDKLEERIMRYVKLGYHPQGGLAVDPTGYYYQAIVKYEEKKEA